MENYGSDKAIYGGAIGRAAQGQIAGYGTDTALASGPATVPEIPIQLERIAKRMEETRHIALVLSERLAPVLRAEPPRPAPGEQRLHGIANSGMGSSLAALHDQIEALGNTLGGLLNRLEL